MTVALHKSIGEVAFEIALQDRGMDVALTTYRFGISQAIQPEAILKGTERLIPFQPKS